MQSNFDKNFESFKMTFKQTFGIEWNTNYQLYLTYLQTLYISSLTEIAYSELRQLLARQDETHKLIQKILARI